MRTTKKLKHSRVSAHEKKIKAQQGSEHEKELRHSKVSAREKKLIKAQQGKYARKKNNLKHSRVRRCLLPRPLRPADSYGTDHEGFSWRYYI